MSWDWLVAQLGVPAMTAGFTGWLIGMRLSRKNHLQLAGLRQEHEVQMQRLQAELTAADCQVLRLHAQLRKKS